MAIFSPGAIVASIHGSFGGITFRRTAGAPVLSLKPNPLQPFSLPQRERHAQFARALRAWDSTCTERQRKLWRKLARSVFRHSPNLGQTFLSGRNLFFRHNLRNLVYPGTVTDPNTGFLSLPPSGISVDFTIAEPYNVDLSAWPPPYGIPVYFWGTRHLPVPHWTTHETWYDLWVDVHEGQVINVYPNWEPVIGELAPGEHFCVAALAFRYPDAPSSLRRFYGTAHA